MKPSIARPWQLSLSQVASSSNAGSVLINGLSGPTAKVNPPKVPFVSEMVNIHDVDCCFHTWDPDAKFAERPPKALVVFLHGANTHGAFPTTRLVADLMVHNGYAFMSPDLPGHGRSSGMRGYMESGDYMVDIADKAVDHAYGSYLDKIASEKAECPEMASPGTKLFLIGTSMGGNLSLQVALRRRKDINFGGAILLAPMLRINFYTPLTRLVVKHSFGLLPKAEVLPMPRCNHYRDPKIRKECDKDQLKPFQTGDMVKLGYIKTLVDLEGSLNAQFEDVSCPCLVMVADQDKLVDNQGAIELMERARSKDMTLKRYPALHGLMGEPSPLLDRMEADMVRWIDERSKQQPYFIRSSL